MLARKKIIFGLTLTILFTIRYYFALPSEKIETDKYIGQEVAITGMIVSEPDLRDETTRYVFKPSSGDTKILITANRFPKYEYGDVIKMVGKIDFPKSFQNDLGREFNYPKYLAKDNIRYIAYKPEVTLIEKGKGSKFFTFLYSIKNKFVSNIEKALTEPHSSLANGITLGLKQSLGEKLLDTFRTAGIIHIVVLSGYNMTIILTGVMFLLSKFPKIPRGVALGLGALLMLGFAALVGFSATVLRATLMALLAILARFLGRPVLAMRTLFIAGIAMLFWNPLILFYDPSFQLSFLATFGLIAFSPIVESKCKFLSFINQSSPKWKQLLKEIFVATVATQIFVLPALIYMTGQFSLVSLPVNLLLLPLVPWAMLSTLAVGSIGFIPILGKIVAIPAYILLETIIKVSEISAKIPLASITISNIPLWFIFIWYLVYLLYLRNYARLLPNSN